jgi:hypothetical protein
VYLVDALAAVAVGPAAPAISVADTSPAAAPAVASRNRHPLPLPEFSLRISLPFLFVLADDRFPSQLCLQDR